MKKIFALVLVLCALFCFAGCKKTVGDPEIEKFSVTHVKFSDAIGDTVWNNGERSSVFKVQTAENIMNIPQTSTTVVYIAEGEEIYLEVITTIISSMGKEKEIVEYTLYVPENFIEGYAYQPM